MPIENYQCRACKYVLSDPVDLCPVCNAQFYWMLIPKEPPQPEQVSHFVEVMNAVAQGHTNRQFLTHGGHFWLPHLFWSNDPEGLSLEKFSWFGQLRFFQHESQEQRVEEKRQSAEPNPWDTNPRLAIVEGPGSKYEHEQEELIVMDDGDDWGSGPARRISVSQAVEPASPFQDPAGDAETLVTLADDFVTFENRASEPLADPPPGREPDGSLESFSQALAEAIEPEKAEPTSTGSEVVTPVRLRSARKGRPPSAPPRPDPTGPSGFCPPCSSFSLFCSPFPGWPCSTTAIPGHQKKIPATRVIWSNTPPR